jgi:hypothetical protein
MSPVIYFVLEWSALRENDAFLWILRLIGANAACETATSTIEFGSRSKDLSE